MSFDAGAITRGRQLIKCNKTKLTVAYRPFFSFSSVVSVAFFRIVFLVGSFEAFFFLSLDVFHPKEKRIP